MDSQSSGAALATSAADESGSTPWLLGAVKESHKKNLVPPGAALTKVPFFKPETLAAEIRRSFALRSALGLSMDMQNKEWSTPYAGVAVIEGEQERRAALERARVALRAGFTLLVPNGPDPRAKAAFLSDNTQEGLNCGLKRCADLMDLALSGYSVSCEEGNVVLDKVLETLVDVKHELNYEAAIHTLGSDFLTAVNDLHTEMEKAHAATCARVAADRDDYAFM